MGDLGIIAGHSDGYFRNKLARDTFAEIDIRFLESEGIRYEDIKPLSEDVNVCATKADLADVLVEIRKTQEMIKEIKELCT